MGTKSFHYYNVKILVSASGLEPASLRFQRSMSTRFTTRTLLVLHNGFEPLFQAHRACDLLLIYCNVIWLRRARSTRTPTAYEAIDLFICPTRVKIFLLVSSEIFLLLAS